MTTNTCFDYSAAAGLFLAKGSARFRSVRYLRFDTGAEALRYLVEEMPPELLSGAVLETGDKRLEGSAITALYQDSAYPLARA